MGEALSPDGDVFDPTPTGEHIDGVRPHPGAGQYPGALLVAGFVGEGMVGYDHEQRLPPLPRR